jgi:hypothetical protein
MMLLNLRGNRNLQQRAEEGTWRSGKGRMFFFEKKNQKNFAT